MNKQAEQWKPISDFPGYEVSDHGRVRSYYKRRSGAIPPIWDIASTPQRILKPTARSRYRQVLLRSGGKSYALRIPRLVLMTFVGPPPEDTESCHNDGDSHNDNLDNLRWDTHTANMNESSHNVDPEIIREIREKRAQGASLNDLAGEYDYTASRVCGICTGRYHPEKGGPPVKVNPPLSDDAVRAIRKRRQEGITYRQIGEEFGISESGAWRICKHERYADE